MLQCVAVCGRFALRSEALAVGLPPLGTPTAHIFFDTRGATPRVCMYTGTKSWLIIFLV